MTQEYDNEKRGALFPAKQKRSANSPDYNGSITMGGVEYWLSGWLKQGRNGQFLSISVGDPKQPVQNQGGGAFPTAGSQQLAQNNQKQENPPGLDDFDPSDDIPF